METITCTTCRLCGSSDLFDVLSLGEQYINDFVSLSKAVGFNDPRKLSASQITVNDPELAATADRELHVVDGRLVEPD